MSSLRQGEGPIISTKKDLAPYDLYAKIGPFKICENKSWPFPKFVRIMNLHTIARASVHWPNFMVLCDIRYCLQSSDFVFVMSDQKW